MARQVRNALFENEKKWDDNRKFFKKQFDIDIQEVYLKLKNVGKISANKYRDMDTLNKAIYEAANNAYQANMIFLISKRKVSEF